MKQKTCRLKTKEEFFAWVENIKSSEDYKSAKEILIKVLTAQFKSSDSLKLFRALKENFPNAKIIGTSMTNFGRRRSETDTGWVTSVADLSENYAVISCIFFYSESSKVTIYEVDAAEMNSVIELATCFSQKLKKGYRHFCRRLEFIE